MTTDAPPRCAIVTGTTSGIGAEVAAQLLRRGWSVIGMARRPPTVSDARYEHLRVDLADAAALEQVALERVAPILRDPKWRRIALAMLVSAANVAISTRAEGRPDLRSHDSHPTPSSLLCARPRRCRGLLVCVVLSIALGLRFHGLDLVLV